MKTKLKLVVLIIVASLKTFSQTTFTATNAQISGTLTSSTRLDANCMHVQDTIHANGGIISGQDVDIQGNLNLSGNINAPLSSTATLGSLITSGSSIFNGPINISGFSSIGNSQIFADAQGNLFKAPPQPANYFCYPNAPAWTLGGNNLLNQIIPNVLQFNIGTCDATDFVLKSNNVQTQYIKPDGSVTFGTPIPSNSGSPEYKFNNGPLRLQGTSNFGGPQIVFDGGLYPYGDWGIEYTTATGPVGGLNFWKPVLSPNSFNNLFFIADNGRVGVGTGNLPTARLTVDAWSDDGIFVTTNSASKKAYSHINSQSHIENFVVWGDGRFHATTGQLGFPLSMIADLTTQLNIFTASTNNGIKFTTNTNTTNKIIFTDNSQNQSMFTVYTDGRTCIGQEFAKQPASSVYLLAVNGKIGAREIKVSIQNPWPDYVFKKEYNLLSLATVESYIAKNHHLPNIPSAKELKSEECGLNLGEMQGLQMEKIEEIYLYLIEMDKQVKELKKENEELKKQLKK
jgi:hypothetical protein